MKKVIIFLMILSLFCVNSLAFTQRDYDKMIAQANKVTEIQNKFILTDDEDVYSTLRNQLSQLFIEDCESYLGEWCSYGIWYLQKPLIQNLDNRTQSVVWMCYDEDILLAYAVGIYNYESGLFTNITWSQLSSVESYFEPIVDQDIEDEVDEDTLLQEGLNSVLNKNPGDIFENPNESEDKEEHLPVLDNDSKEDETKSNEPENIPQTPEFESIGGNIDFEPIE